MRTQKLNMQNCLKLIVLVGVMLASISAHAEGADKYSVGALRGVRTIWFHFTEGGDTGCMYQHDLREKAQPMLSELNRLGLEIQDKIPMEFETPPDLTVLVAVEATNGKGTSTEADCAIFVKLEAVHSMLGKLRYQPSTMALRVVVYKTLRYGVAPRDAVGRRLTDTALHAIAEFSNAYFLANPRE